MDGAQEILENVFCNLLGILHPGLQQNEGKFPIYYVVHRPISINWPETMCSVVLPTVKIQGKCYIRHYVQSVLEHNVHKLLLHNTTGTSDKTLHMNKNNTF
jgi:hypothetical protein